MIGIIFFYLFLFPGMWFPRLLGLLKEEKSSKSGLGKRITVLFLSFIVSLIMWFFICLIIPFFII